MKGYIRYCTSVLREHGLWLTTIGTLVVFFALFLFGDADAVAATLIGVDTRAIICARQATDNCEHRVRWDQRIRPAALMELGLPGHAQKPEECKGVEMTHLAVTIFIRGDNSAECERDDERERTQ